MFNQEYESDNEWWREDELVKWELLEIIIHQQKSEMYKAAAERERSRRQKNREESAF